MYLYYSLYRGVSKKNTQKAGRLFHVPGKLWRFCGSRLAPYSPTTVGSNLFLLGKKKKLPTVRSSYYPTKNGNLLPPNKTTTQKHGKKERNIHQWQTSFPTSLPPNFPQKNGGICCLGDRSIIFLVFFLGGEGGTHHLGMPQISTSIHDINIQLTELLRKKQHLPSQRYDVKGFFWVYFRWPRVFKQLTSWFDKKQLKQICVHPFLRHHMTPNPIFIHFLWRKSLKWPIQFASTLMFFPKKWVPFEWLNPSVLSYKICILKLPWSNFKP